MGFEPHEGSWVRIPSGAQIFSVSSYGRFFTSPFISFINYNWNEKHLYERRYYEQNSSGGKITKNRLKLNNHYSETSYYFKVNIDVKRV